MYLNVANVRRTSCDNRYTYIGSKKKTIHANEGFRQGAENDCNGMTFPFAIFTNFRRKWRVFKKGMRLNFTNFRRKILIFKLEMRLNFTNFH